MSIIDVITYNGESELFDLRYNILKDFVDEFIVVEAPTTFSGNGKQLQFPKIKYKYDKIKYFVVDENYTEAEVSLAESSPNTKGAGHWKHEFLQKERVKQAIAHLKEEDVVFIGDCDEIWQLPYSLDFPVKLKLRVYTYYLNNRSNEQFWGTLVGRYGDIKNQCLNHLRVNAPKTENELGWHFTSLAQNLKQKLIDSYTEESYNTQWVQENLEKNIKENRDFLGRDFTYKLDESEWPEYLKANRDKYKHLLSLESLDSNV